MGLLRAGGTPKIYGDGAQTRDYVYVGDVVARCSRAAGHEGGVYNVGTGRETSVLELYDAIQRATGHPREPRSTRRRGSASCSAACSMRRRGARPRLAPERPRSPTVSRATWAGSAGGLSARGANQIAPWSTHSTPRSVPVARDDRRRRGGRALELVALIAIGARAHRLRARAHAAQVAATVAAAAAASRTRRAGTRGCRPHPLRPRSHVRVLVLNGNGVGGAAAARRRASRGAGYRIGGATNAQRHDYARSMVMFVPGWVKEARRLAHDAGVRMVAPLDGLRARAAQGIEGSPAPRQLASGSRPCGGSARAGRSLARRPERVVACTPW